MNKLIGKRQSISAVFILCIVFVQYYVCVYCTCVCTKLKGVTIIRRFIPHIRAILSYHRGSIYPMQNPMF